MAAASGFDGVLFRWDGPAGWTFVVVPPEHAPDLAGAFGRVPVTATVGGVSWSTSVWRDQEHGWLLAVPKRVRKDKDDGDRVHVVVEVDPTRL